MASSRICVDASVVVRLVVPDPLSDAASALWASWEEGGVEVVAPSLLLYEATNVLYRYLRHGLLTLETVRKGQEIILDLPISFQDGGVMHRRALAFAEQLQLSAAYDSHYLAVAESQGAEFWTADGKLARHIGARLPWVRLLQHP